MPYATIADVEAAIGADRLLDIADHNGDRVLDTDTVERALEEASSTADSYLPILPTVVPAVLRRHVVNIAVHNLREPRERGTDASLRAYEAAMRWLEWLAEDKVILPSGTPGTPPPSGGALASGGVVIESTEPEWTHDVAKRVL